MASTRFPVLFVSHGGGPWPWVDGMKEMFARTASEFAALPARLPGKPAAVLVITGHWEAPEFSVSTARHPPMDYDYSGFPEHTYHLQYPAPGSPELAKRVRELLSAAGLRSLEDPHRGFDHGTFVPLSLMYPQADVPVVLLSLKSSYDPQEHLRAGDAIAALRSQDVLIMGSGLTYHNMSGFGRPGSTAPAQAFEEYLHRAVVAEPATRDQMLVAWQSAPAARLVHPREDHLLPLMVAAGAAQGDRGERIFVDHVMQVPMASYRFGVA